MNGLIVPPHAGLIGPDGAPVAAAAPAVVGLNVYEALGGDDALEAARKIRELRQRREKVGTVVVELGQITENLLVEIELFNQAAWQGLDELPERDAEVIAAAVRKRERRKRKRARDLERESG